MCNYRSPAGNLPSISTCVVHGTPDERRRNCTGEDIPPVVQSGPAQYYSKVARSFPSPSPPLMRFTAKDRGEVPTEARQTCALDIATLCPYLCASLLEVFSKSVAGDSSHIIIEHHQRYRVANRSQTLHGDLNIRLVEKFTRTLLLPRTLLRLQKAYFCLSACCGVVKAR
jgi:hypothetical protein